MNKYITQPEANKLSRTIYPIPDFITTALKESGLEKQYRLRPAYQRNDYVGWITRAKLEKTKLARLNQMLDELKQGRLYMKMSWKPSK